MGTSLRIARSLRPTTKLLPEHAREHNRSLVLQALYSDGPLSRADVARATRLTRMTVGDLVTALIDEGLVIDIGQREEARPGKPATLIDVARDAFQIIGVDMSDHLALRGAVLSLEGQIVERAEVPFDGVTGEDLTRKVVDMVRSLVARASRPILGIGVGSPGIVDGDGVVVLAANLGWHKEPLRQVIEDAVGIPVIVANDANAAALAEHSFGGATPDALVVTLGHGVGAGLIVNGAPVFGSHFAAGEIGHVTVGTDQGPECACGKHGCLETWLAVPRLEEALSEAADQNGADQVLGTAGARLGIALAPVVGALDLSEIVLAGPVELVGGALLEGVASTLQARTLPDFHGHVNVRPSEIGPDIVVRGTAVMVLSARLGVS